MLDDVTAVAKQAGLFAQLISEANLPLMPIPSLT